MGVRYILSAPFGRRLANRLALHLVFQPSDQDFFPSMAMKASLILVLFALLLAPPPMGMGISHGEEHTPTVKRYPYDPEQNTVIGRSRGHTIVPGDTLLDLARRYELGYNEMELLYPRMDIWTPPPGRTIAIPTFWVLPSTRHEQLVINLAELRLYFFDKDTSTVQTYPIGIGDEGFETPLGTFFINEKRANPTWYIPASLQEKYGMAVMPPGPKNPLGEYIMKFSAGPYGIHGTIMPWGVGRLISHGCIRCYPEHIRLLYPQVSIGTKLEIIYEPLKLGWKNDQVFLEAHPDVYKRIPDYREYALEKLENFSKADLVDLEKFMMVVNLRNGVPTNITRFDARPAPARMTSLRED